MCDVDVGILGRQGDHLFRPWISDMTGDDLELRIRARRDRDKGLAGRVQKDKAAQCVRLEDRKERRARYTRRSAGNSGDCSGGRSHGQGTIRSALNPRSRTHRRSSRTASIGRNKSTEATPTNRFGACRTHSATESFDKSGPLGAHHAHNIPSLTPASSIALIVHSSGRSPGANVP